MRPTKTVLCCGVAVLGLMLALGACGNEKKSGDAGVGTGGATSGTGGKGTGGAGGAAGANGTGGGAGSSSSGTGGAAGAAGAAGPVDGGTMDATFSLDGLSFDGFSLDGFSLDGFSLDAFNLDALNLPACSAGVASGMSCTATLTGCAPASGGSICVCFLETWNCK